MKYWNSFILFRVLDRIYIPLNSYAILSLQGRLTREYNQIKSKGVYVISPYWLYTCVDEQRHVDESLFPSTYNPKLTLPVVKTRRSVQVSKEVKVLYL